ncbi:MAG TPA: hypothetical protein VHW01_24925 [Polyangiaceae bacterium]|nr:hypothetical protein [Polyangiaceae bacterium]
MPVTSASTHALRAWERRYGTVDPRRTAGGSRRASSQSSALPQARRDLADELTALGKPAEAARFRNEAVRAAAP